MNEEMEKELFVSECLRLETFVRMYISTGYSDREICSVLGTILKEIIERQPDPKGAFKQAVALLAGQK